MDDDRRRQMLIVSSAAMSLFLISFDINMVNIALPTITTHFDLDVATSAWLVILFGVVLCGLLLPFGKAGDVIGHRRLFILGMAIFAFGNIASGLSYHLDNFLTLVVLRGISATGAAMMVSVNFAIVSLNLPEEVRGRGLGFFSIFGALGFMLGPLASGVLIGTFQWNWIFYLSGGIGILGLVMSVAFIPESGGNGKPADVQQTIALFLLLLFGILALNRYLVEGLTTTVTISAVVALAACLIALRRQSEADNPLMEPEIIKRRDIMLPLFCMSLIYMCYSGSMVLLPFYLEYTEGLSPSTTGMLFLLPALFVILLGPISGGFADRHGSYQITLVATGVMVVSMIVFVTMGSLDGFLLTSVGLLFMGVSHGLFNAPNNRSVFCNVPLPHIGTASGMHQMIRQVGNLIGAATMPAVYQMFAGPEPSLSMMLTGFEWGFGLGLMFAILAMALAITMRNYCRG